MIKTCINTGFVDNFIGYSNQSKLKECTIINFKKIINSLALGIVSSILSVVYAVEPSSSLELTPNHKFYVNRNGGISHNTFVLEKDDNKFFFKECKKKLSMYDTAKRTIKEYFKDEYIEEQESMIKSLSDEQNLIKFIYMKTYGDGKAAKWLNSADRSDTSALGLSEPLPDNFKKCVLPDFLPYAFAEFVQYRANRNKKIGEMQINQQLSALATMRIAELLDLSNLVVKTEYIKIKMPDSTEKFGIIMDCAKGMPFRKVKALNCKKIAPSFQKDISNLMILDALCAQRDRSVGNYFTVVDEKNCVVSLNGYDNELAFDNYKNLKSRLFCLPALISSDDMLVLPHMDKTLADKILNLSDQDIRCCLEDLLSNSSINATLNRLHQIQNAIRKSINQNPHFLVELSEWSDQTIDEELSVNYDTYLKYYVKKLN